MFEERAIWAIVKGKPIGRVQNRLLQVAQTACF